MFDVQRAGRHTASNPSHRAISVMSCNVRGVACATCRVTWTRPIVIYGTDAWIDQLTALLTA
jgi:hypothetical protein